MIGEGNIFSLGLLTPVMCALPWCFSTVKPILDFCSPGVQENVFEVISGL